MTKFFFKFKKPIFDPFPQFLGKTSFSKKWSSHAQIHNGYQNPGKIQGNLMIQFQENSQEDVKKQGWTDPISWDPSSYRQGSSK